MKKINISIRRSAFLILMLTATISVSSIFALWVFTVINKSEQKIAEMKLSYISEQRKLIKKEVKQVVLMIDFLRSVNDGKSILQMQDEILDYFSSVRLNYGGYIFINKYDGRALVFDGLKIIGDKNIRNLTDPDGFKIFEAEVEAVSNPDGDFFTYKFKRLSDTIPSPKLSYVYGYNDWEWIIGAGIYLDDISLIIQQEKNNYQSLLFKKVLYIILVLIVLIIALFILATFLSSLIQNEFKVFMSFLTNKSNDTSIIDTEKLHIVEFKQIALTANVVINKQRSAEELLITERDKAHKYLNIADVIILALDTKGIVTLINRKGSETLEYDVDSIVGKNWFSQFIPLSEKKILFENFLVVMSSKGSVNFRNRESRIMTKSGDERIISWYNTLLFNNDGDIIGSLSSGRDMTERRIVEKSFSESEEKYRLLFEKTSDAVLIMGVNDTFIDCNNAALKILGYRQKKELIGLHPDGISPAKQPDGSLSIIKATEMIAKARLEGYNRFEWLHFDKNKNPFHVDVSLTVIPIAGIEYLYVVWRDITERKKQDAELIIAKEKAEQGEDIKTSFLHNMQHEIRTPLNAIMGFSQLLKQGGIDSDDINSCYDDIISSGNQLSKIIDNIIDFSRLQAGFILINNKNIELKNLVSEIFREYIFDTQNKTIKFTINTCNSNYNTIVRTDEFRLKQIIGNLLSNAFKFTEKGSVELGYNITEDKLLFYVTDTGVGIEEKYFESIFDRFNRITYKNSAKLYGGGGLGLSISMAILKYLNGDIWVESEIGKGSKFLFSIPYRSNTVDYTIQKEILDNSNITVVTNDRAKFDIITNVLRETEANIIHIKSGREAVEFCQNNYTTNLMIMDIDLEGMNGITSTKAIKAFNKELPIIALCSNNLTKFTKEDALIAGCENYISVFQRESEIKLTLSLSINNAVLGSE